MAIEKKDALFTLVKSLTKSEKRQFKLYVGRLGGNANANFIALFNLLDKMKAYDEKNILKNTNIKKQQLSNSKAHLYKQLLVSLKLNPQHQNIRNQIREQLDFASILYNKGLYKQSLKILDKVKHIAIENEENTLAYEIVELEKVVESQYITRSLSNRAEELSSEARELSIRNVMTSKLSNLSLQLYSWLLQNGYAKSEEDINLITRYLEKNIPSFKIDELGFKEKLFLYKVYLWHSLITQDFVSSYRYSQKWIDLFEVYPKMRYVNPVFYLKGYNYLLESLFMIQHSKKFDEILNNFENDFKDSNFLINENTSALATIYFYQNKLNQYFLNANFQEGVSYIPVVLKEINNYKKKIDAHHIMVFYYKIGCMYFGVDDYENCILYLNKIISNKELTIREDLLCYARVLNLVAHYEAGIDENIDNLIKSTYKFLIKMDDMHIVQRKMMQFLRSLTNMYPTELKSAFKTLRDELKEYENHPYEKRSFLYLDIISWLESNIENVPIAEIIRRKMSV